ncbi:hypothetical protein GA565_17555 [Rouxiella sp. S1S-2]|uniref:beta strand repeat-containing protein n=1 Tax=Rouxiella sp. S1S-2 TaxID=2653856 RepID=UPI0012647848|nr:hypothetical protein [Rouxiella sp. S1S-2]KAB7897645.1 hypothetical protein GA565_17555 [Rouxiella sp. S1S-2]
MANVLTLTRVTNGAQADGSSNNSFQVLVNDSVTGAGVANVTVTLSVTTGATLTASTVTTGSAGSVFGYVTSITAASYVVTAALTGATSKTISVIFTSAAETAAAQRALETMQSALSGTTGSGYVGYDQTLTYASGTIGASLSQAATNLTTNNNKLAALATSTGAGSVGYDSTVTYTSGTVGAAFNSAATNLTTNNNKLAALATSSGAGSVGYDSTVSYASGTVGSAFNSAATNLTSNNNQLAALATSSGAGSVGYDSTVSYANGTVGSAFNSAATNLTSNNNQLAALATSSGAGSVGYSSTVSYTGGTLGSAFNSAATNLTSINNQLSALATSSGAGSVGYDQTIDYANGTLGSAFNYSGTTLASQTNKLARYLDIEDFADTNSAAGDWTTAIQAAIDAAVSRGILEVRGTGSYAISGTVKIRNIFGNGLNISIHSLSVTSSFPSNTSFWNATPMISIGDLVGNATGLNLFINVLDGGSKADGIVPTGYGFALSHIHIGSASNCIAVVRTGAHQWPNSSNQLTGDYWSSNYVGVFLKNGTTGTNPIVEGWKVSVKFIAANYWGGIWLFDCGQYAQLSGDWDYNGRYVGVIELDSTTGLSSIAGQTGLKLTNGTTPLEFLFYYTYQGSTYAVVAASSNISVYDGSGTFPWTVGQTISCTTITGVSLTYTAVTLCGDNASKTNFFDIFHDFERTAFGRIQVKAGYLSGIIGGLQHTSNLQYQNSYEDPTDCFHGLSVTNSGTTLAFINTPVESSAYSYVTADYVNFQKKLYMQDRLYEGTPVAIKLGPSSTTSTTITTLKDSAQDKHLDEGSIYDITLKTNYAGNCGSYRVFVLSSGGTYSHNVISSYSTSAITVDFADNTTGVDMNFRQQAQSQMQVVINIVRI